MVINPQEMTTTKTVERFPNIVISKPNDTLPVVIKSLEKGDMQLIVEYNNKKKVVASMSGSAINILYLLRTLGSIHYCMAKGVSTEITDIEEYLNCIV